MMTDAANVAAAYIALGEKGLNFGAAGNVSLRQGEGMLITPTGARADTLSADKIVEATLGGTVVGTGRPSSEWEMHAEIYRAYPAARAVVHTHSDACVAMSALRRRLPPFHYMIAAFGGDDVRCAGYDTFGTSGLAHAAVAALDGRRACYLANHGMICHGPTLEAAVGLAERLEVLSRQYLMALTIGDPALLTPDEMAEVHARYRALSYDTMKK